MFSSHQTQYITPDIYIQKGNDGQYTPVINEEGIPQLRIASHYTRFLNEMEKGATRGKAQEYLVEKNEKSFGFYSIPSPKKKNDF